MSIGGWLGWTLGALVSFFTAFIGGVIGTGVGLFFANKFVRNYLP